MTSDETPELLPCPFCGGRAELDKITAAHGGDNEYNLVVCVCGASSPWSKDLGSPVKNWNTRPTPTVEAASTTSAPSTAAGGGEE